MPERVGRSGLAGSGTDSAPTSQPRLNRSGSSAPLAKLPGASVKVGFLIRPLHELCLWDAIDRAHFENSILVGLRQFRVTGQHGARSADELNRGIVDRFGVNRDRVA